MTTAPKITRVRADFFEGGLLEVHRGWAHHFRPAGVGGATASTASDGTILSPMPGKIIAVNVAAGDAVTKGQKLLTLEAMKMEHSLVAPFDGAVESLSAEMGAQVNEGAVLAEIVPEAAQETDA